MNSKDKSVVSVLSVAASALALICFVTGRTSLSSFVSPQLSPASSPITPPSTSAGSSTSAAQTESTLTQAAFFVHFHHLPGHGTDDYEADDTEQDRQNLITALETYIASASDKPQEKKRLARAQDLRHQLGVMHLSASPIN